uniref:Coiled-coil domain-containing protein 157 n=1 Tax=Macrostomum lignano TaxID=282301 RepID=A0A1I8HPD7_9PLAT
MAHLLGSEYCLKSLSSDARDLHNVLQELIAKAGPVPVMSWKFPDKKACDLDIPYLLQQYAFCMDEPEANQFILTHLPAEAGQSSGSQTHAGGSSLGLAAKKFWNRMGQMSLLVRQLTDEARLSELRQQQQKEEVSQNVVKSNKTDQSPIRSAVPNSTKSCQTVETAFVPCDSCSEVQHGFSRISAHLSALCEKERLPSSLRIYRAQLQQANGGFDGDWLAASDLERAADAEKAAKSRRELESKMDKLVKQYEATVDQVSSANKALEASKLQLMKDIEAAKKSIEQQEELIKLLDRVKNRVKQVSKRDDLSLEDLELAVGSVGERLTDLTDQLCQAREETQAAATQCENLARQNESLQAKHRMTAERVAELSAENEQLKEALDELEEFKDNHRSSEAQDNLTLSVQRLKSQVSDLQTSLQKSEDEKRLLIEYPDLNGPVNQDVE